MRICIQWLLVLLSATLSSNGQILKSTPSFSQAVKIADKQRKPLMLTLSVPANYNQKAAAVLNKEVITQINQNFVVCETTMDDPEIKNYALKFGFKIIAPCFYFFKTPEPKGLAYQQEGGRWVISDGGKKMIREALEAVAAPTIEELEMYFIDSKDTAQIKSLILTRQKMGISDNAEWIDRYANLLSDKDLNDYQTVLFILKAGPYAYGTTYKKAFTNKKIIDSLYKTEPLNIRVNITNAITQNTLNKAIKTKDIGLALKAAENTKGSWGNDHERGNKAHYSTMLAYYGGVKDTTQFLYNAAWFYDKYYMKLTADSIKKLDEQIQREMIVNRSAVNSDKILIVSKKEKDSIINNGINLKGKVMISPNENPSFTATNLNNIAFRFYELNPKDQFFLIKAVLWSKRSIELNPIPEYYDTLAHLFYRLGWHEEALHTEQQALGLALKKSQPTDVYKTELKKIKEKTL